LTARNKGKYLLRRSLVQTFLWDLIDSTASFITIIGFLKYVGLQIHCVGEIPEFEPFTNVLSNKKK
jgi:uncharacterized protein Usg